MTDESNCSNIRESFNVAENEENPEKMLALEAHVRNCNDCRVWREQTIALETAAQYLPQFDVSELLTQRIMNSVAADAEKSSSRSRTWILVLLSCISVVFLYRSDAIESIEGLVSWLVGGLALVVFKLIIGSEQQKGEIVGQ